MNHCWEAKSNLCSRETYHISAVVRCSPQHDGIMTTNTFGIDKGCSSFHRQFAMSAGYPKQSTDVWSSSILVQQKWSELISVDVLERRSRPYWGRRPINVTVAYLVPVKVQQSSAEFYQFWSPHIPCAGPISLCNVNTRHCGCCAPEILLDPIQAVLQNTMLFSVKDVKTHSIQG
jgi:hypothetical protein